MKGENRAQEILRNGGTLPTFDDLDERHLLNALHDIGFAEAGDMGGFKPIKWSEIKAYADVTERLKTPWDFETLREMSHAYCVGRHEGGDLFTIAPIDRGKEDLDDE